MAKDAPIETRRFAKRHLLVLLILGGLVFFPVLREIVVVAIRDPESIHAFAGPLVIGLLVYWRRSALVEAIGRGSIWGLLLLLLSLAVYSVSQFPFHYNLVEWWSMIPALAGIIWAAAGWKFLTRCLPMLVIVGLAIPIGDRIWAFLVIRPETITTQLAERVLDLLPGVFVELVGVDLHYERGQTEGAIALGQHFRGVQLLLAYTMVYVLVTFSRIRPMWQLVVMAVAMVPVVALCNLLRLLIWGVVTIYVRADPISLVPRVSATVLSLVIAYGLAAVLLAIMRNLTVPSDDGPATAPAG